MPDEKTIAFYNSAAERYAKLTDTGAPSENLTAFMALLPAGGAVLDLGCGPARASVHLRDAGFAPDPVDASVGMIELANEAHNIAARLLTFDDIDMVDAYDGVWANFSLLHAAHADLPRILEAIAVALHSKGVFHIAMKTGTGEARVTRSTAFIHLCHRSRSCAHCWPMPALTVLEAVEGHEVGCAGTDDPYVADQGPQTCLNYIAYTDGACSGNPGPGGWGAHD